MDEDEWERDIDGSMVISGGGWWEEEFMWEVDVMKVKCLISWLFVFQCDAIFYI